VRRSVFTVHSSYQNYAWRHRLMLLPVFAGFRRIVCCSRASYDSFPAAYRWLAGSRLLVIQNGVNLERIDRVARRPRDGGPRNEFRVSVIGRLIQIKNPFAVLRAFEQVADGASRLVYVGAGALRDPLLKEIESRNLQQRVELTGLLPRDEVYRQLLDADLFVSASHGEGLPLAVLEAMASGAPVVLSDIGPHREIAAGADFIPLVEPDDVPGLAREMARFQDMPPAVRAEIGAKCRRLVEQRFSMTAMHEQYASIYAELLRSNGFLVTR
jgi:glycosyltransferase involved in cell wall biosynthesis